MTSDDGTARPAVVRRIDAYIDADGNSCDKGDAVAVWFNETLADGTRICGMGFVEPE